MKKKLLLMLLLPFNSIYSNEPHHDHCLLETPKHVSFNNTFFSKLDGVRGIIDPETIYDCFRTVQIISQIMNGVTDPVTKKKVGVITHNGTAYTLKELAMMTNELTTRNAASTDPQWSVINSALKNLKQFFHKAAGPLLEKTKKPMVKAMNLKLIHLWIQESGRHTSLLKNFGDEAVEMSALEQTNPREFYTFLNDLKCFLKDLMRSAPKACIQYKKECLKLDDYAKFDSFLNS